MASGAIGVYTSSFPSSSYFTPKAKTSSSCSSKNVRFINSNRIVACSAVQESSTSTASETKPLEQDAPEKPKPKPKPKPAAKAAVKPLPEMMEEEVIPSLNAILEGREDLNDIDLSFKDNKLEGSFLKKGIPYSFWAFFPSGDLTGPKGFSLSSYGSEPSTVEPFLIDEKKITAQHVIFWVEKRLAAQGIIPVWTD